MVREMRGRHLKSPPMRVCLARARLRSMVCGFQLCGRSLGGAGGRGGRTRPREDKAALSGRLAPYSGPQVEKRPWDNELSLRSGDVALGTIEGGPQNEGRCF